MNKIGIIIPEANDRLKKRCMDAAVSIFGNPSLPEEVSKRLTLELDAITSNGYASDYLFASSLADKASELGYPASTRGVLSSSFLAYLCGISKVNPLPLHYHCPEYCHYFTLADYDKGYDARGHTRSVELSYDFLDDHHCPICGTKLKLMGNDLQAEMFLGKDYRREPNIILNFPVSIRNKILRYMVEQFPEYQFIRAGTSIVRSDGSVFKGIHPGGVFIVPKEIDIKEYTLLRECDPDDEFQMPITDTDFHELDKVFRRYDILTLPLLDKLHDLADEFDVNLDEIDLYDRGIIGVFQREGLSFIPMHLNYPPYNQVEQQIFSFYKPNRFSDIVRIRGLMSGVNTWIGNGDELIQMGINPRKLISCRDDVYQELIEKDIDRDKAWDIMMGIVRGGGISEEDRSIMVEAGIPSWYIDSCSNIRYLFPKSQAIEYTILYAQLAYFRAYHADELSDDNFLERCPF